jgi:hypothetical protein
MTQSAIATAADYADAMLTARKAKNTLFILLLLMILAELGLFFFARYGGDISGADAPNQMVATMIDKLKYVIGGIGFLGVIVPPVLSVVLLLILQIMLIGRLIGVSKLVKAFIWSVVLGLLLFPWQAILINQTFTSPDFKIPGVLFTWAEMLARAKDHPVGPVPNILFWGRFVGFPVLALLILLLIQGNSSRGLRLALGEITPEPVAPAAET